jgi:membrane protein
MTSGDSLSGTEGTAGGSTGEPEHGRVERLMGWLRKRSDRPLGRLGFQWFRAYFAASRNSGCAIAIYSALSVLPAALVFVAALYAAGDVNLFAQHLVDHLNLTGNTASLVQATFGSSSSNALAASLTMVVTFLLWGIGIGQLYQDVYARAWGIKVASAADQALYAVFFFVFAAALALVAVAQSELGDTGRWLVLVPVWILGSLAFWLGTPYFLLHRKIDWHKLLPGALMATLVLGGTAVFSPLFLGPALQTNGRAFGSLGVVLSVVGYLFVMVTLSLVCAVFSPVWFAWRADEKSRADEANRAEESPDTGSPPALDA